MSLMLGLGSYPCFIRHTDVTGQRPDVKVESRSEGTERTALSADTLEPLTMPSVSQLLFVSRSSPGYCSDSFPQMSVVQA